MTQGFKIRKVWVETLRLIFIITVIVFIIFHPEVSLPIVMYGCNMHWMQTFSDLGNTYLRHNINVHIYKRRMVAKMRLLNPLHKYGAKYHMRISSLRIKWESRFIINGRQRTKRITKRITSIENVLSRMISYRGRNQICFFQQRP